MTSLTITKIIAFFLALPLFAVGSMFIISPSKGELFLRKFPRCKIAGLVLSVLAWFFTAYELDTIGIEIFDRYLKMFPGELWILAIILSVLTYFWMENLLPIRGVAAIAMLYPAEMFKYTRLVESDWRLVLVVWAYICIVFGMFAMFYPWHIRRCMEWISQSALRIRFVGAVGLVLAMLLSLAGIMM